MARTGATVRCVRRRSGGDELKRRLDRGQPHIRSPATADEHLMPLAGLLEVVAEVVAELVGAHLKSLGGRRVELRGFEPLTYALPARRSVQLSYSPGKLKIYRKIETRPLRILRRRQPEVNRSPVRRE